MDIYAQLYSDTAAPIGGKIRVNKTTVNAQSMPSVAALRDGGFAVAWQSVAEDGSGLNIHTQRYDDVGAKVGNEFRVNTTTARHQNAPSIVALADEGFVIVWTSSGHDGSGLGVYAQVFDGVGQRSNVEFQVNTTIVNNQYQPAATGYGSEKGTFVVVWTSVNQDGSLEGVYGQRFEFEQLMP